MLAQDQYRRCFGRSGVPKREFVGQVRQRVLHPWRHFPRHLAYLLAGNTDPSLARRRRRGERPLTMRVLIEWLLMCKRVDHDEAGRASLQALAELIDCDVVPRPAITHHTPAEEIADVSRAVGEAVAVFAEAMTDAELDTVEATALLTSLHIARDEVDEAIAALREVVQ